MSEIQMNQAIAYLRQHWGHEKFRESQLPVLQSILAKKDTLAIMPTGGGKSICFQIPALCFGGLTLVISPLVALMMDQVANLRDRNIEADAIHGGLDIGQQQEKIQSAKSGQTKLLYISPERLKSRSFLEALPIFPISLVAVDEAHCISQWGHDFRPAYRNIAIVKEIFPSVPVIALSATATTKVQEDIVDNLKMVDASKIVQAARRENLSYQVKLTEDKYGFLLKYLLQRTEETGIIYTRSRKAVVKLSEYLRKRNLQAKPYHAGLSTKVKSRNMEDWVQDRLKIIVATNAFGMGIDKSNVRFVVHLEAPPNLEEYVQEAGRAGRDGQKAEAILLVQKDDENQREQDVDKSYPPKGFIKDVYKYLSSHFNLGVGDKMNASQVFNLKQFCDKYKISILPTYYALGILEKMDFIFFSNESTASSKVMMEKEKVDELLAMNGAERQKNLVNKLLRIYDGILYKKVIIDETIIASFVNGKKSDVEDMLASLAGKGYIQYDQASDLPRLKIRGKRIETKLFDIPTELYDAKKERALIALNHVKGYIEKPNCRQIYIDGYFGKEQNTKCGICDYCLSKTQTVETDPALLLDKLIHLLESGVDDLDKVMLELKEFDDQALIGLLEKLEEEKMIDIIGDKIILNGS